MATGYFDFLTYPITALGLPLTMYLLLENDNKGKAKKVIIYSIVWGTGYIGMWTAKWAIGSLILQENVFKSAISQAVVRTSHIMGHGSLSGDKIDYFSTVKGNL